MRNIFNKLMNNEGLSGAEQGELFSWLERVSVTESLVNSLFTERDKITDLMQITDMSSRLLVPGAETDNLMDSTGYQTSADLVNVNWWLPLNLADDEVNAIVVQVERTIGGTKYLYVGGSFKRIGGTASPMIARYNYTTREWEKVGDGTINGTVWAIAFDSADNLYIGGEFTNASGVAAADYIAKLSGSTWVAVGGGVNNFVFAIALDASDVPYIGGAFVNAGGDAAADYIAKLSAGVWVNVGGGVSDEVYTIVFDASYNLYIGGSFINAGGDTSADFIATLSAGVWVNVGGGVNSVVKKIAFDANGELYIGGVFTDAGGDADADNIAMLSAGAWVNVGGGVNNDVYAIAFDSDNNPYIGGEFTDAGGNAGADRAAKLVNGFWEPLSNGGGLSGVDNYVYALTILDNGSVIAGGSFNFAGSIQCQSIAIYCKPLSEAIDVIASLFELYANKEMVSGESVMASTFAITAALGTFEDTGLSVALPHAGKYRIRANVRGDIDGNAGTSWWIVCKFYNATTSADVTNSERMIVLSDSALRVQTTASMEVEIEISGATTINLYAMRNGAGGASFTQSNLVSSSSGRTVMNYERLGTT